MTVDRIREAILFLIAFVLSTAFHEFGHAWVATRLGDPLPEAEGRLTLSPLHHIDLVGTIIVPLVMGLQLIGGPLLAWGRPVRTNPTRYTRRFSMSTGSMLVAVAGPAMNLVLAAIASLIVVIGLRVHFMPLALAEGLMKYVIVLNISLMMFNLLPVPPLDGGKVLAWVLPRSMQSIVDFLERWGGFILLGLLVTGATGFLMRPAEYVLGGWLHLMRVAAGL